MAGINVTLSGGRTVTINVGETFEAIKAKLGDVDIIFDNIDTRKNDRLDNSELEGLKTTLEAKGHTVEVADDGKTPLAAFNDSMQNSASRYDKDKLNGFYKSEDADKYEVQQGDTLYKIAKRSLEEEGLPTDARSCYNRVAQIAKLNDISDVNVIETGTKYVVRLTEKAVRQVKAADGNSVAVFTGAATPNISETSPLVEGRRSTITVRPNEEPEGEEEEIEGEDNICKYTKDGTVTYCAQIVPSEILVNAPTLEKVKELRDEVAAEYAKIKGAPTDDSDEDDNAKKARIDTNVAAFKRIIELTEGNIDAITDIAGYLKNDNYVDRTSDDYKALVQDLLLTRNGNVIDSLLKDSESVYTDVVLENDETANKILAGIYQEIRAKENAGEMLTKDEIFLKYSVKDAATGNGYKIPADTENGVHEKHMAYDSVDGALYYHVNIDDNWYSAETTELLDEFLTDLEAANDDDKKKDLFQKYMNTEDRVLAQCLAQNAKTLSARDEDIISLVNNNGMQVLWSLPSGSEDAYNQNVVNAVIARIKDICSTDPRNLENARFLAAAEKWIDKLELSEEEKKGKDSTAQASALDEKKKAAAKEIVKTYLTEVTGEDGSKTPTFNPSRRPTYEEMRGLAKLAEYTKDNDIRKALADYIKLEDMGYRQYSHAMEENIDKSIMVARYAEMVENMNKEEVLDFIKAKERIYSNIPHDKILEKFPDDAEIKAQLFVYVSSDSVITDENRLKLAKDYIEDDGKGNLSLDKGKLDSVGRDVDHFVMEALPADCKEGDAAKYFRAALKEYGKDDLAKLVEFKDKNANAVKDRIGELVVANKKDMIFIAKVLDLDYSILPFDTLLSIDAKSANWDDKTKSAVFERFFEGRVPLNDRKKYLDNAVKSNLITQSKDSKGNVQADRYEIGDNIYLTDGYFGENNNVALRKFSKAGYEKGVGMYTELQGFGSGAISEKLRELESPRDIKKVTGILQAFREKSPNEGLMEYIANEWSIGHGVKPSKDLCNRVPKLLLRAAKEYGLTGTDEFKNLANYFNCTNFETFEFTGEHTGGGRHAEAEAEELDKLMYALLDRILWKTVIV